MDSRGALDVQNRGDRPVLDAKIVQQLRELGEGDGTSHFLEDLVALFDAEVDRKVVELETAIQREDRGAVQLIARSVSGCAGQVGAAIAAGICRRIELAGAAGNLDVRTTELDDLRDELVRARAALRAQLLVSAA